MITKLLDARQVSRLLPKLFEKHNEIYIAAAWGNNGKVAESLFRQIAKFRSVTFGVAFCQTDPDLIDRLVDIKNAFIAESHNGTFHPKLYYFSSGDEAEAIVGSSNFTRGGLGANLEANIHITGPKSAPVFCGIRAALDSYAEIRRPVSQELAARYRLQFNAAKNLKKPRNPILSDVNTGGRQLASTLVNMSWDEYVRKVKSGRFHKFLERLALLRECQKMLASVSSFAGLSPAEWKAIAGVIGEKQKKDFDLDRHDWGWFGSMKGMGDFANRIADRDRHLADAMDGIPRHGNVEKQHYEEFCRNFLLAFQQSHRTGSYPTATRLLAMKRPDVFVCISKPNLKGIATALDFARTTLDLENYWEKVIEPLRVAAWFNAPRPTGEDAELWDGRVAMLDAIFYNPN